MVPQAGLSAVKNHSVDRAMDWCVTTIPALSSLTLCCRIESHRFDPEFMESAPVYDALGGSCAFLTPLIAWQLRLAHLLLQPRRLHRSQLLFLHPSLAWHSTLKRDAGMRRKNAPQSWRECSERKRYGFCWQFVACCFVLFRILLRFDQAIWAGGRGTQGSCEGAV